MKPQLLTTWCAPGLSICPDSHRAFKFCNVVCGNCPWSSTAFPLVDQISDTLSKGCTDLQILVQHLDHRDVVLQYAVKQGCVGTAVKSQCACVSPSLVGALQVCDVV